MFFQRAERRPRHAPRGASDRPVVEVLAESKVEEPEAAAVAVGPGATTLRESIGTASFAFKGYDVTNLGRSDELLAHPAYGTIVRTRLDEVSAIASEVLGRRVDLAARVAAREEAGLESFSENVATIVAIELAQMSLLKEFHGVEPAAARQSIGYSIGEMAALISGGAFDLEQLLPVPLACASDCASLAEGSSLGVLFSRGPALPLVDLKAFCDEISGEGLGLVGVSAYLSPNTALIHGEGETLRRVAAALPGPLPESTAVRAKSHSLPPLHTPIVWRKNVPNRAATALYAIPGKIAVPHPRIISCVTGGATYAPGNVRDTLIRWTDHPQLLWDVVEETLRSGVETLIHVGPAPNLIPATFQRLANNVARETGRSYFGRIGRQVGARLNRHAWLARMLPSRAALLRAPGLTHVILEDWLLEHSPTNGQSS